MRLTVEVALRSRPRKIHNIVFLGGDSKVGELRRYVLSELGKDIANDTARGFFLGSRRLDGRKTHLPTQVAYGGRSISITQGGTDTKCTPIGPSR